MSFKKFSAAESEIQKEKPAAPDKAAPVMGPQEKPAESTPSAETPAVKV